MNSFIKWNAFENIVCKMAIILSRPQCVNPGNTGIILCTHPSNDRRHYKVMSSLIGRSYTQNDPCNAVRSCVRTLSASVNDHDNNTLSTLPEIIFCMRPANERRHYNVMASLIGWAHTENVPYWPSVGGGCHLPVDSRHKGSVMQSFDIFFFCF